MNNQSLPMLGRNKAKIVVTFTGLYPEGLGGPAVIAAHILTALEKSGSEAFFFCPGKAKQRHYEDTARVKIHRYESGVSWNDLRNPFRLVASVIEFYISFLEALRKSDVVLYNSPPVDMSLLTPLLSRAFGRRVVAYIHGGLIMENWNPLGFAALRAMRRLFHIVLCPSEYAKRIAIEFGFHRNDTMVLSPGVDLSESYVPRESKLTDNVRILWVGNIDKSKGVDTLIKAAPKIKKMHPGAEFFLIGTGRLHSQMKRLTEDIGASDYVTFLGSATGSLLREHYSNASIFVLPSIRETFGIVILEAMAAGLPLVVSNIDGGPSELISEPRGGRKFKVGDEVDLAKVVCEIIDVMKNDPGEIENIIRFNLAEVVPKYDWAFIERQYLDILRSPHCEDA